MFEDLTFEHVLGILDEKFIHNEPSARAYYLALKRGWNVLFTGRGGYAKSERWAHLRKRLEIKDKDYFLLQANSAMKYSDVWGPVDMPHFKETGRTRYSLEYSWLMRSILVIEEIGDMNMRLASSFKDPWSSGIYVNDGEHYKLATHSIFATSNLSPAELARNESISALMERFHLHVEVTWPSHTTEDYESLFTKVLGSPVSELAIWLAEKGEIESRPISPRVAIRMAETYLEDGPEFATLIGGVPAKHMERFALEIKANRAIVERSQAGGKRIDSFEKRYSQLTARLTTAQDIADYSNLVNDIKELSRDIHRLQEIKLSDRDMDRVMLLKKELGHMNKEIRTKMIEI